MLSNKENSKQEPMEPLVRPSARYRFNNEITHEGVRKSQQTRIGGVLWLLTFFSIQAIHTGWISDAGYQSKGPLNWSRSKDGAGSGFGAGDFLGYYFDRSKIVTELSDKP